MSRERCTPFSSQLLSLLSFTTVPDPLAPSHTLPLTISSTHPPHSHTATALNSTLLHSDMKMHICAPIPCPSLHHFLIQLFQTTARSPVTELVQATPSTCIDFIFSLKKARLNLSTEFPGQRDQIIRPM